VVEVGELVGFVVTELAEGDLVGAGRPDGAVDGDLDELVGAPEGSAVTPPPSLQSAGMGPCTTAP